MSPDELEDLKGDLKELKQAKMAVGLVFILLRRLGLTSAVGTALKRYLGLGAAVGGVTGHAVMNFRPELLPGFTATSSIATGMVLGTLVVQLLGCLVACVKPLRFYGRFLEARILYRLGAVPVQLFCEIRDTELRRYFLGDEHHTQYAPTASHAPLPRSAQAPPQMSPQQAAVPAPPRAVPQPQKEPAAVDRGAPRLR